MNMCLQNAYKLRLSRLTDSSTTTVYVNLDKIDTKRHLCGAAKKPLESHFKISFAIAERNVIILQQTNASWRPSKNERAFAVDLQISSTTTASEFGMFGESNSVGNNNDIASTRAKQHVVGRRVVFVKDAAGFSSYVAILLSSEKKRMGRSS